MSYPLQRISEGQLGAFFDSMAVPFSFEPTEAACNRFKSVMDLDRLRGAFDGSQIVGTFGAYDLELSVPGGIVKTAGTTVVTVLPTHRRQGILRSMMHEHFQEAHERGEPLVALWASESNIYGRFGYGPASQLAELTLDKTFATLHNPIDIRGTMRLVDIDEAMAHFPAILERVMVDCPGLFRRSEAWWRERFLSDIEQLREGASAQRCVLHSRDGESVGYVVYRTRVDTEHENHAAEIVELVGVDADAERALWQFIFGVDLVRQIKYWNQPVDDPLQWWIEQPRRLERQIQDALWVRLVDVATALQQREYSSAGRIVFALEDPQCPWNSGVFQLETDDDGNAVCTPSSESPDVHLTPFALGTTYLGNGSFRELARAKLINGKPSALCQLDNLFQVARRPWCQEVF